MLVLILFGAALVSLRLGVIIARRLSVPEVEIAFFAVSWALYWLFMILQFAGPLPP